MYTSSSGDLSALREQLVRDQRNMKILRADKELRKPITPVCDCSDLIEFLGIRDPTKEQRSAYTEGIRRYFVKSEKILLVPAWAYEFLNHKRKIIVDNIGRFGCRDGYETFMARFPRAKRFRELWELGRYDEAESLYAEDETWVQILALTRDKNVEDLLGNSIRRFNALVSAGNLMSASELINSGNTFCVDKPTLNLTLDHLNKLRPKEHGKNEVDARALATVFWFDENIEGQFFTAVTASKDPLSAFYHAIDERQESGLSLMSLARSPISGWISDLIETRYGPKVTEYLDNGIAITTDLIEGLDMLRRFRWEEQATDGIPTDEHRTIAKLKGMVAGLLDMYDKLYREPIFRQIEKYGARQRKPSTLSIEESAIALDPPRFVESMRNAREALRTQSLEMVDYAGRYIKPGGRHHLGGRRLDELYGDIARDFARDVF